MTIVIDAGAPDASKTARNIITLALEDSKQDPQSVANAQAMLAANKRGLLE
jgi:hypothetical protein